MSIFSAFRARGNWFRGNCHTHSTLSDGKLTPQEVTDMYAAQGYNFLVLTDHGKCHETVRPYDRDNFIAIGGVELHPPVTIKGYPVSHHLVGIGVEKGPKKGWMEKQTAARVIRWVERQGGIAVYAHPYWSGHDINAMIEGRGAFGVEIFNSVCWMTKDLGNASAHVDQALQAGLRWRLFAVDDTHHGQRDPFGGWIMVKAPRLTPRDILAAIRKGHFYSTQGPVIHSLGIHRGMIRVECSPVKEIIWHCAGPFGQRYVGADAPLTSSEMPVAKPRGERMRFVRVELVDVAGKRAWSNPIFWDAKKAKWVE